MSAIRWLGVLLAACGGGAQEPQPEQRPTPPISSEDLLIRVTPETTDVDLGRAFGLTVVRVWSDDLVPDEFNESDLAPLTVSLVDTAHREDGGRTEETRHYKCYAFSVGAISVPPLVFRATSRTDADERSVSSEELSFSVASSLPPEDVGPAELPRDAFPAPFPWARWLGFGAVGLVVVGFLFVLFARHGRKIGGDSSSSTTPAHVRALQQLEALRQLDPESPEETRAYFVEASQVARVYIEEQFSVHVPKMTTEEFLAAPDTNSALSSDHCELLAKFLGSCDLAKFARHTPTPAERGVLLVSAETFVRETSKDEDGGP